MKFIRVTECGAPCWRATARWLWADTDWNPRFPFGFSAAVRIGPYRVVDTKSGFAMPCRGFTLDINGPFGEPNRLYLWLGHTDVTLGLVSWWAFRETGREGRQIHGYYARCRPYFDGCDRYRYHQDATGKWVRNDKPEPLHWGWLTIERRRA